MNKNSVKYISAGTGSGKTQYILNNIINGDLMENKIVYCCQTTDNCIETANRLSEINPVIVFGKTSHRKYITNNNHKTYNRFSSEVFENRVIITTHLCNFKHDSEIFEKISEDFKRTIIIDELPETFECFSIFVDNEYIIKDIMDEHEVVDHSKNFYKLVGINENRKWYEHYSPYLNKFYLTMKNKNANLLVEKTDYNKMLLGQKKKVNFIAEYDYSCLKGKSVILLSANIMYDNSIIKQTDATPLGDCPSKSFNDKKITIDVDRWLTTSSENYITERIENVKDKKNILFCVPAKIFKEKKVWDEGNFCTSYTKGTNKFSHLNVFIDLTIRNLSKSDLGTLALYFEYFLDTNDVYRIANSIFRIQILQIMQNAGRIGRNPDITEIKYILQTFKQAKEIYDILRLQGYVIKINGITHEKVNNDPAYNYILDSVKEVFHDKNERSIHPQLYHMVINHPLFYKFEILTNEGKLTKLSAVAHLLELKRSTLSSHYSKPYKKMSFEEKNELNVLKTERNEILLKVLNDLNKYKKKLLNTDSNELNQYDRKKKIMCLSDNTENIKISFYVK